MDFLFFSHSHFRWIIILVGLVVLIKFLSGWLGKATFKKTDRLLMKIYAGVIDLQVTLGLIYMIWSGLEAAGFPRFRLEHAFLMMVVLILVHLFGRWKTSADAVRFRNGFFLVLISLILIVAGVLMLPGGLNRWMMGAL
jgi:hypothetical protein